MIDKGNIRAVLCDIDGTLLTSEHAVTPRTIAAIRALRERGVLFGLCTGRNAPATEFMFEQWGLTGLVDLLIGTGGGEVIDYAHEVRELSYPLSGSAIKEIVSHFEVLPAYPVCPNNGVLYVNTVNPVIERLSRVDGVPYELVDFDELLQEPQPKVMFACLAEDMPLVVERAQTFSSSEYKSASLQTTQRLYEYMDPRVSKTRGLTRVAELNGFGIENICAFGDADNDADMVANAGWGVAMANGSDKTRAAADAVTLSNDEDGIAVYIEEHLL